MVAVLTLILSSINAYMSNSSNRQCSESNYDNPNLRNFTLVNYYCPNNVHLNIQNINVKSENMIIVGDFNIH